MLYSPDGAQLFSAARGLDRKTIDQPQSQVSQSVVQKVTAEGQPILTSDAQTDTRFNMRESVMLLGLRSVLCVPLKVKDDVRGVIYADNRFEAGIFTQADLDLLNTIASIAAMSIENARLYQMAVEKGRLQRELQLAREIQSSFLPQEIPQIPGWEFATRWYPAQEVAGDYYDFIPVGDNHLGLTIADVTDKGAPASLFMVFSNSIVRASVHPEMEPAQSITNANRLIASKSPNAMFVTLVYVLLNPRTGQATYVNAGHNPPLYYSANENRLMRLSRTGMVLGIEPDANFFQRSFQFSVGDVLLLYTDGLTDAMNSLNQPFTVERLEKIVVSNWHLSVDLIMSKIEEGLFAHTGDTTPFDDVTLLLVKRQS